MAKNTKKGSNTNDDMKYVRNNLYGYGFREQSYIAPTKSMNEIETDIDDIQVINTDQTEEINAIKQQIDEMVLSGLTKSVADSLYGVTLALNTETNKLQLKNGYGEVIGEEIDFNGGSAAIGIKSIELVHEDEHGNPGTFLKFVYTTIDEQGHVSEETIYVDVKDLEDVYTAGNGIEINNNEISVLLNGENDYIEVTNDGISTNGLDAKITSIEEIIANISPGEGLVITNPGEAAFGNYNVSNDGTLFSIGNGTSDENRSNALEVRDDGSIWANVEGEYLNIIPLLSMLAHETYN